MTTLDEILGAFEEALELERELGTRTVECDRALLMPVKPEPPKPATRNFETSKPETSKPETRNQKLETRNTRTSALSRAHGNARILLLKKTERTNE